MSTPHNNADYGEIAKTVLMPGDPLRAKLMAETFLKNVTLVSEVRNIYCYTGDYKGKKISVMASGMGMPSMGIYSYELYKFYDVESIIRIGSAGAYTDKLHMLDLVLAESVWSESTYAKTQSGCEDSILYPNCRLNENICAAAKKLNVPITLGRVHSSDVFYQEDSANQYRNIYNDKKCICVEMESFALFHNAHVLGKEAACMVTISDSFVTDEKISAAQRQNSFMKMLETALEAAIL